MYFRKKIIEKLKDNERKAFQHMCWEALAPLVSKDFFAQFNPDMMREWRTLQDGKYSSVLSVMGAVEDLCDERDRYRHASPSTSYHEWMENLIELLWD